VRRKATVPSSRHTVGAAPCCHILYARATFAATVPRGEETIMFAKLFAAAVMVLCTGAAALADEPMPDSAGGRYTFNKVADGFVRLDTRTGEVALCSQRAVGWACQAAPEDRAALEGEIVRLRNENAALKQSLLSRGLPLPPGAVPEMPGGVGHDNDITIRLPSDGDIDRAVAYMGRMWHRFVDAVARAQRQMLDKS
jgi:hypothetical protein